jgi:hypothetical protein
MEREAAGDLSTGLRDTASFGEITQEGLREVFPHWRIFVAGGTWWAVRGGWQSWTGPESLLLRALTAPDLTGLAERLCLQEWLDGLDSEALAAVYRGTLMGSTPWEDVPLKPRFAWARTLVTHHSSSERTVAPPRIHDASVIFAAVDVH